MLGASGRHAVRIRRHVPPKGEEEAASKYDGNDDDARGRGRAGNPRDGTGNRLGGAAANEKEEEEVNVRDFGGLVDETAVETAEDKFGEGRSAGD